MPHRIPRENWVLCKSRVKKELVKRVRAGMRVRYYPLVHELEGRGVESAAFTAPPP